MSQKSKNTNAKPNVKTVYFGLCTESKYLYDLYNSAGFVNYGFFSNKVNPEVTGSIEEGFSLLNSKQKFDQIFCCATKNSSQIINELIRYCYANKVKFYLIPDQNTTSLRNFNQTFVNDIIVYELVSKHIDKKLNLFFKRFFDIVFSLLVIVFILSWLFPLLAILIRLESKGSVLFIQKRNGIHNQVFNCLKFRTMFLNDESDHKQALEGDKRISKLGKFLRRTSIDEFPQFFNVLMGDMSVIGPRPHMIKHNEMYDQLIENYNDRTLVKPGITGLAQILGYRGETESDIFLMKIRVRMDNFYINNWSFLLDLKVVYKTIYNVFFQNKNAF